MVLLSRFIVAADKPLSQGSKIFGVSFNLSRRNIVAPMSYYNSRVIDAGEMWLALRGDAAQMSSQMLWGCEVGIVVPAAFFMQMTYPIPRAPAPRLMVDASHSASMPVVFPIEGAALSCCDALRRAFAHVRPI